MIGRGRFLAGLLACMMILTNVSQVALAASVEELITDEAVGGTLEGGVEEVLTQSAGVEASSALPEVYGDFLLTGSGLVIEDQDLEISDQEEDAHSTEESGEEEDIRIEEISTEAEEPENDEGHPEAELTEDSFDLMIGDEADEVALPDEAGTGEWENDVSSIQEEQEEEPALPGENLSEYDGTEESTEFREDEQTTLLSAGTEVTGTFGNGVYYKLSGGVMSIYGSGSTPSYSIAQDNPIWPYRNEVQEIQILDGITGIGEGTFYMFSTVQSVYFLGNLETIGAHAFNGCTSLSTMTLPDGLVSIGTNAFYSCAMYTVTVPASVTSVGIGAFAGCSRLVSATINGPLTKLDNYVFNNCSSLTTVVLPSTIKTIGTAVFNGCSSLTAITLPSGLTSLGESAFGACSSLKRITLPDTVNSLGTTVFGGCSSLTTVNLPSNLVSLPQWAFYGCTSLQTITLPNSLSAIGEGAFRISGLTSIEIPESVAVVGGTGFYGCDRLERMIVLNADTSFGASVLDGCSAMTAIYGHDYSTAQELAQENGIPFISYDDADQYSLSLSETVFAYDGQAKTPDVSVSFDQSELTEGVDYTVIYQDNINAGEGRAVVSGLGRYSAVTLTGIFNIVIDSTLVLHSGSCGSNVQWELKASGDLTLSGTGDTYHYGAPSAVPWYEFRSLIKTVLVDSGVTSIGDYLFYDCTQLTGITISSSVTSIGNYAFYGCTGLEVITIPSKTVSIGSYAFSSASLNFVTIPTSVKTLGEGAFEGCAYLSRATVNGQLTRLEDRVFYGCGQLNTVTLPLSMKEIGVYAFAYCQALSDITLPYRLESLEQAAFSGCSSLNGISLPSTVEYVGPAAFASCQSLTQVSLPNRLDTIQDMTFAFCENLSEIGIPASVTRIGDDAFACTGFEYVEIPETVLEIGQTAFKECNQLIRASFPGRNTTLGLDVFERCSSLQAIHGYLDSPANVAADEMNIHFAAYDDVLNYSVTVEEGPHIYTGESICPWVEVRFDDISLTEGTDYTVTYDNNTEPGTADVHIGFFGRYAYVEYFTSFQITMEENSLASGMLNSTTSWNMRNDGTLEILGTGNTPFFDEGTAKPWEEQGFSPETIEVKEGITGISDNLFSYSAANNIILPDSLETIGEKAFCGCSNLTYLTIPGNVNWVGDEAFSCCTSLEYAWIYGPLFHISREMFSYDYNLKYVSMPDTIYTIGDRAFYYCGSLENAGNLADYTDLREIGSFAFASSGLSGDLSLPETLTTIKECAFDQSGISRLVIPENVHCFEDRMAGNCPSLRELWMTAGPGLGCTFADGFLAGSTDLTVYTYYPEEVSAHAGYPGEEASVRVVDLGDTSNYQIELSMDAYVYNGQEALPDVRVLFDGRELIPDSEYSVLYENNCDPGEATVKIFGQGVFRLFDAVRFFTIYPDTNVIAEGNYSNSTGSVHYVLMDNGTLVISGEGAIPDAGTYAPPWKTYSTSIHRIQIEEGITRIGESAFSSLSCAEHVSVPDTVTSIGVSAFAQDVSLKNIHLSNNLEEIGARAFSGCSALRYIRIPYWANVLGTNAFSECTGLTGAVIESNLTGIPAMAFYNCYALENVVLPQSVETIGEQAFRRTNVSSMELPGSLKAIETGAFSGCSRLETVEFPSGLESIGNSAFASTALTSVSLPDTVATVGQHAFSDCSHLQTVWVLGRDTQFCVEAGKQSLGDGLAGENKVYGFNGTGAQSAAGSVNAVFTAFDDPDNYSLVMIDGGPFYYDGTEKFPEFEVCFDGIGLKDGSDYDVWYNDNIMPGIATLHVYGYGIYETAALDEDFTILMEGNNVASGNCGPDVTWRLDEDGTLILSGTGRTMDYNAEKAPWYTWNSQITSILIEEGIGTLGEGLFYGCGEAVSVSIPESVFSIGKFAFYNCTSLGQVTLPNSVSNLGENAFYGCSRLEEVTLSTSLAMIPIAAFQDCGSLTRIVIPEKVYEIASFAFKGCESLEEVYLPSKLAIISNGVFESCTALQHLTLPGTLNSIGQDAFWNTGLKEIELPAGMTSLDDWVFEACSSLETVTILSKSVTVYDNVFSECTSLQKIYGYMGTSAQEAANNLAVTFVAFDDASQYAMNLVDGPSTEYIFDGNEHRPAVQVMFDGKVLTEKKDYTLTYSDNILAGTGKVKAQCAGRYAGITLYAGFSITEAAETLHSGSCGTSVGWTLMNDGTLILSGKGRTASYQSGDGVPWKEYRDLIKKLQVKSGITGLGDYLMYNCTSLQTAELPDGLTSIGKMAFFGCETLTGLVLPSRLRLIDEGAFFACTGLTDITLPGTLTTVGELAFAASGLKSVTVPSGVTTLGGMAFAQCPSLGSAAIKANVSGTGMGLFTGCKALTSVTLANPITSIDMGCFKDCTKLKTVTLPSKLKTIGQSAFEGTSAMTAITLPSTLTSVGSTAFGRSGLTTVTLPASVTSVGSGAFKSCSALKSVIILSKKISVGSTAFSSCSALTRVEGYSFTGGKNAADAAKVKYYAFNLASSYTITLTQGGKAVTADTYTYTGVAKKPVVTVKFGGKTLKSGTDYTFAYAANVNAGTAKVNVTGKGRYVSNTAGAGTKVTKSFTIKKASLKSGTVTLAKTSYACTGALLKPVPTVKVSGRTLKNGTDFTITYTANRYVGTAKGTIKGIGNYLASPTRTFSFKIVKGSPALQVPGAMTKYYGSPAFALGATSRSGKLTYASSNKNVATISTAGKVTVKSLGTTTITVTSPATANFNKATATVKLTVALKQVVLSSVTSPSKTKLSIKWQKNTTGQGYEVYVSSSKSFTSGTRMKKITNISTVSIAPTGVTSGKVWYVRMRVYRKIGTKMYYGPWSVVKSVKAK